MEVYKPNYVTKAKSEQICLFKNNSKKISENCL